MVEEKSRKERRSGHAALCQGIYQELWQFIILLESMDNSGVTMKKDSGKLGGPFGSEATYDYSVKIGVEYRDLLSTSRRGFRPRRKPKSHISLIKYAKRKKLQRSI
jgi:hypothetical protein